MTGRRTGSDTTTNTPGVDALRKVRRRSKAQKRHDDGDTTEKAEARTKQFLALLETMSPEGFDLIELILKIMIKRERAPGAPSLSPHAECLTVARSGD